MVVSTPIQYEVNGGGLQTLNAIDTNETHADFYAYDATSGSSGHGYGSLGTSTLLVHYNPSDDTYALIIQHGHAGTDDIVRYAVRTTFSERLPSSSAYIVRNDAPTTDSDSYNAGSMTHEWLEGRGDGAVIDVGLFSDVTFSLDHTWSGDSTVDARVDDFRVQDGNSTVSAGKNGSIRLVVPDSVVPTTSTFSFPTPGDKVVMLRPDLAHR